MISIRRMLTPKHWSRDRLMVIASGGVEGQPPLHCDFGSLDHSLGSIPSNGEWCDGRSRALVLSSLTFGMPKDLTLEY
ncbi:hypothetical protein SLA2020_438800 [Shorea laevis]